MLETRTLILPPFFTPGTLFVYSSVDETVVTREVPYLTIANSSQGRHYAFSPSEKGDHSDHNTVPRRIFNGPRTVVTLVTAAASGQGEILPLKAPSNHSAYTVRFFGPAVQCTQANSSVQTIIRDLLARRMAEMAGTMKQIQSAYFGFVPSVDPQGTVTAMDDMRYQYQTSSSATNEVWMAFERYKNSTDESCDHDTYFQVCSLWNATYDLSLAWENGFQSVTGSRELLHEVAYPVDPPGAVSNMAQHAYSAFFWALADQLVGSFSLFQEASNGSDPITFGYIQSPIQHTSLLGTSDLNVFFDYNEDKGACQIPYANQSAQRRQDIDLAKNKTLGELVEDLSFNITVSLLHNDLFTSVFSRFLSALVPCQWWVNAVELTRPSIQKYHPQACHGLGRRQPLRLQQSRSLDSLCPCLLLYVDHGHHRSCHVQETWRNAWHQVPRHPLRCRHAIHHHRQGSRLYGEDIDCPFRRTHGNLSTSRATAS